MSEWAIDDHDDLAFAVSTPEALLTLGNAALHRQNLGDSSSRRSVGQSFLAPSSRIAGVSVGLSRVGSPTNAITIELRTTLGGAPIATASIPASAVTSTSYTSPSRIEVRFASPVAVTAGDWLYMVARVTSNSAARYYRVSLDGNVYPGGTAYTGTSLSQQSSRDVVSKVRYLLDQ